MNDQPTPVHAPMKGFPIVGGHVTMGGHPLPRLAARIGQTPFYAYSRDLMSQRVMELRQALPHDIHLHYAMKANPMPAVVTHMAGLVDGLDVASRQEMSVALDTGIPPISISFAGPGKTEAEIISAVAAGIILNVESQRELDSAAQAGQRLGVRPKIALRVNPDFDLKGAGMNMGGGAKPFGIDAAAIPDILPTLPAMGLEFYGFHIFSGSQNLNADTLIEAQGKSLDLAIRLAGYAPAPIKLLNIGGGFGIPYFPGDRPVDITKIGQALTTHMPRIKQALPDAELVIELGRFLVGEAGIYVCRILDKKISHGQTFLVTDGGLHHHLAVSGNFGQFIRKNYPVTIDTKADSNAMETVTIVGPLCTPLDLLADKMSLPKAEIGDLVVIFQSGAYGLTASPLHFLSHPKALEVLL